VKLPCELNDLDRRIWLEELDEFVPARVFDAHTHIYHWDFYRNPEKDQSAYQFVGRDYPEASRAMLDACDAALFPGRTVDRLAFPFPFATHTDFAGSNAYLAEQLREAPRSAGLLLVHPEMSAEEAERDLDGYGFLGFKPYRFFARNGDPVNCRLTEFMPEHLIALADRRGLLIMMHLSKRDAIADPENMADLQHLAERYPRVRWILAHCARSYSSWAIERAASVLRRLTNCWFDTSSVCESDAFDALYSAVGVERVMYGSDDVPVGVMRGKYIAFGYAWAYLSPENQSLGLSHCDGRMTFTRYEQLRAMRRASKRLGITAEQNRALFCDTATNLIQAVRAEQL
jgi:glutamate-1-semialdehyde 2,1-aminomutase